MALRGSSSIILESMSNGRTSRLVDYGIYRAARALIPSDSVTDMHGVKPKFSVPDVTS